MKKKIILLFVFCFFGFFLKPNIWALDCSVIYKDLGKLSAREVNTVLEGVTSAVYRISSITIAKSQAEVSQQCHFEVSLNILPDLLAAIVSYGGVSFIGGSQDVSLAGLKEAFARAFYKGDDDVREQVCVFFGLRYNLNCIAFGL